MGQVNVVVDQQPIMAYSTEAKDPKISGTYASGITDVAGVAAANNYLSIENPVGNTKLIVLLGLFISTYVASGMSTTRNSMTGKLASSLSGGTVVTAANIVKFDSTYAAATAVLRTGNPTVTLGANVFNSPPPINASTGQYVHSVGAGASTAGGGLLLRPGEGFVVTSAAGNTSQTWNMSVQWGEI